MILRDYQQRIVAAAQAEFLGHRSVLAVAPTGSGKTVIFSHIVQRSQIKRRRTLILAHRVELVDQIAATLKRFFVPHSYIAAGYPHDARCLTQIGSVFTVARWLQRGVLPPFDFIVVDEAHHATTGTTWGKILAAYPNAKVLGVTATPIRLDGSGMRECFSAMVLGPSVADLITAGALSPFRVFAPPTIQTEGLHTRAGDFVKAELQAAADNALVTGDAVTHYRRLALGRRAVAFCVSVAHAEHVAAEFAVAGFRARSVDGSLDREVRRQVIQAFVAGHLDVLTSCDLVSEGFDVPAVEVGISLRPTQSEGLWLQQCGRVLRPSPGKAEALIIDHAGNTLRHGLPDDERDWSLDGMDRKKKGAQEVVKGVRVCLKCFAAIRVGSVACTQCGTPFPVKAREVETQDGDLVEVDKEAIRRQQTQERNAARSREQLIELGTRRGYKRPAAWADHVLNGRRLKEGERMAEVRR